MVRVDAVTIGQEPDMKKKTRCKKTRYRDKKLALSVVRHFAKTSVREKTPVRAYYCTDCNGWHITSQSAR